MFRFFFCKWHFENQSISESSALQDKLMSLRRPPKIFFQLVFAALATIVVGHACGQGYPTTQYGSFAGGVSGSQREPSSPHAVDPVDRSQS
ncbi:MAG: hypothetical protein ACI814_004199, partial [Mariniblastus sp.]